MDIRKVVIPVAGWGTRSVPASKNIPKEMLPIYDKPVIQYIVEEAVKAGIRDVVFVASQNKKVVEDHFDYNPALEMVLREAGKTALLDKVLHATELVNIMSVRQKKQLGLGHAVLCAREIVGHDDAFACTVGDDLMFGENVPAGIPQLVKVAQEHNMPCIGVMEVPADKVNRYGIAMGDEIEPGIIKVSGLVEKPAVGTVSSRLAIVGRYVLTSDIFSYLDKVKPGAGGEIQLTDALAMRAADRGLLAVKMNGLRFDAGDWVDYLAANVYFGLRDEKIHDDLLKRIRSLVQA
ncbi:MAG: UTP--glucose-1-phosphate uridylyltransferase [Desulfovibrionaceae bacterium]|nr:UTP--glucose-1-phosphate uridylyltransferase [Desulfovibrionaceae bacterium]